MTTRGLPYDILETIFSLLDKKSLLSVTLASRELNELASRSLYSSVIFNKNVKYGYGRVDRYPIRRSNPFFAFDRRPLLRNVVRQVVLCSGSIQLSSLIDLTFALSEHSSYLWSIIK